MLAFPQGPRLNFEPCRSEKEWGVAHCGHLVIFYRSARDRGPLVRSLCSSLTTTLAVDLLNEPLELGNHAWRRHQHELIELLILEIGGEPCQRPCG